MSENPNGNLSVALPHSSPFFFVAIWPNFIHFPFVLSLTLKCTRYKIPSQGGRTRKKNGKVWNAYETNRVLLLKFILRLNKYTERTATVVFFKISAKLKLNHREINTFMCACVCVCIKRRSLLWRKCLFSSVNGNSHKPINEKFENAFGIGFSIFRCGVEAVNCILLFELVVIYNSFFCSLSLIVWMENVWNALNNIMRIHGYQCFDRWWLRNVSLFLLFFCINQYYFNGKVLKGLGISMFRNIVCAAIIRLEFWFFEKNFLFI